MSDAVSSAGRARDAVALAIVAAGAGAYLVAWRGMDALAANRVVAGKGEYLMSQWNDYRALSFAGIAGMVTGIALSAWSYHRHRKPTVATPT